MCWTTRWLDAMPRAGALPSTRSPATTLRKCSGDSARPLACSGSFSRLSSVCCFASRRSWMPPHWIAAPSAAPTAGCRTAMRIDRCSSPSTTVAGQRRGLAYHGESRCNDLLQPACAHSCATGQRVALAEVSEGSRDMTRTDQSCIPVSASRVTVLVVAAAAAAAHLDCLPCMRSR